MSSPKGAPAGNPWTRRVRAGDNCGFPSPASASHHRLSMHRILSAFSLALLVIAADCVAQAVATGDEVLAENGSIKLTLSDYGPDLLRVPPKMRAEFPASPKRLTMMLNN